MVCAGVIKSTRLSLSSPPHPLPNSPSCPSPLQLNQPAGSTLLKLSVADKDSPKNGPPFEFRIISGNEGNTFSVDQTGELRANRVFGPDATREFTLEVQVRVPSVLLLTSGMIHDKQEGGGGLA